MIRILAFFLLLNNLSFSIFGQQYSDKRKKQFEQLFRVLQSTQITNKDLEDSWKITSELNSILITDYIDSTVNGVNYVSHSLTKTFSDICIKAGGQRGVNYYFNYLSLTKDSPEEERSFALERLFVKYPEIVLKRIGNDKELLDELTWGFLNNRYYGAKNPFENIEYTAKTVYDQGPKPVLNKGNCREIFFETNPSLKEKYKTYKNQIDYIINSAIGDLDNP